MFHLFDSSKYHWDVEHLLFDSDEETDALGSTRFRDEEPGHPFRGNQYVSGERGGRGESGDDSRKALTFSKGSPLPAGSENLVGLSKWTPPGNWSTQEHQGTGNFHEPELPTNTKIFTGAIVTEPDGRVWLAKPTNAFGGYEHTFPKGKLDPGLSPRVNAIKEVYEETGLKVKLTGYAGDYKGDTGTTRYYTAERVAGSPADHGRESEAVVLAPRADLLKYLNKERDQKIAKEILGAGSPSTPAAAEVKPTLPSAAEAKLAVGEAQKVGSQLGSNKGGVYVNKAGEKFYVKEPPTEAHVTNEKVAAALYKLAGARTLEYVDAGPKHVATRWQPLEKNNVSQLSQQERQKAQQDFAVHAWTANWDAAGLGGDNQGVVKGQVTTLDVGGALEYRAQGGPKGAAFGTEVKEVDTLRSPSTNADAAKLYGDMTHEQIKESLQRVASLTNDQIRGAVLGAGGSEALASKMMARRDDLAARVGSKLYVTQPKGTYKETPPPPLSAAEKAHVGPDPLKQEPKGLAETHPEIHAALIAQTKGSSAERVALRKLLADYKTPYEARKSIQSKILTSFQMHHASLVKKGKAEKAAEIEGKLAKYAGKYGMPQYKVVAKTTAEANLGFSSQDVSGAQEVMKSAGGSYTPEETKSFNDLVALVGTSQAKSMTSAVSSKVKGLPMTAAEAAHIYAYTTSSTYHETNKLLRDNKGENLPLKYQNHVNALNAALSKLPDYAAPVWRKISVSDSTVQKYRNAVGSVVTEHQFSSSAKSDKKWHGNVWFHIQSKTGKDISKLSAHGSESEVLFRAGTQFRITDHKQFGGNNHFYMEEVAQ